PASTRSTNTCASPTSKHCPIFTRPWSNACWGRSGVAPGGAATLEPARAGARCVDQRPAAGHRPACAFYGLPWPLPRPLLPLLPLPLLPLLPLSTWPPLPREFPLPLLFRSPFPDLLLPWARGGPERDQSTCTGLSISIVRPQRR